MEHAPVNKRTQLLRPGLAIIIAAVGLMGTAVLGPWCGCLTAVATVILVAQSVDMFFARQASADGHAPSAAWKLPWLHFQFRLQTLLLTVTMAAVFLGLSRWNRLYYCNVAFDGYIYGFPFRCLNVPNFYHDPAIDFLSLAADIAIGVALVVGITLEARHFGSRGGKQNDGGTAGPQSETPKPRLRWYQYTLGSLLLVMLAISIGLSCWIAAKTHRERMRIVAALKSPTQIEFVETPLSDVVDYLQDLHHIEIRVDKEALRQAGISESTEITYNVKGVSLQSGLRLVLQPLDLGYMIRGKVLLITTARKAAVTDINEPDFKTLGMIVNEERIAEALKSPTQIEFTETPLKDVLDYLKDLHHIEIQLDEKALREAGISESTEITHNVNGVPLHSGLRSILWPRGLDCFIHNEVLFVTTSREAAVLNPAPPNFKSLDPIANEKQIADVLASPAPDGLGDMRLQAAIEHIAERYKIAVAFDPSAWKQAETDTWAHPQAHSTPVSVQSALAPGSTVSVSNSKSETRCCWSRRRTRTRLQTGIGRSTMGIDSPISRPIGSWRDS